MKKDNALEEMLLASCVREYLEAHCAAGFMECEACSYFHLLLADPINNRPISSIPEQLFLAAWLHYGGGAWMYCIQSQVQIGKYFTDFTVSASDYFIHGMQGFRLSLAAIEALRAISPRYAVEIDGFEWHDKTPEQAEYDKKRERKLQLEGYIVLRFAAREILRDPNKCVKEILLDRICFDAQSLYSRITFA